MSENIDRCEHGMPYEAHCWKCADEREEPTPTTLPGQDEPEEDENTCASCHKTTDTPLGLEPTKYCNLCAQERVYDFESQLTQALTSLAAAQGEAKEYAAMNKAHICCGKIRRWPSVLCSMHPANDSGVIHLLYSDGNHADFTEFKEKLASAGSELASLREQNATYKKWIILKDCRQCHGSGEVINSEEGGMLNLCDCHAVRIKELRTELQSLREKESAAWIDVKRELPPEREQVLVYTTVAGIMMSSWFCWFPENGDPPLWHNILKEFGIVTHWMPLPVAPTKLEQETK